MSNRTLLPLAPFAEDALTTIPPNPIPGTSYRDPAFAGTGTGWPFSEKVESQEFNQTLFVETSLMKQLSDQGVLDYSNDIDYYAAVGAYVKDDGGLYKCEQDNGPSTSIQQPSAGLPYWRRIDITEVSPLNNDWNGFFDRKHQLQLPSPAGYPATSGGGGTVYTADAEWSLGNFSSGAANTISSDDDGVIFSVGTYKLFTFTSEQLALIDVNTVPVYLVDETGKAHFVNNATSGVNVTKPDATTLKVELTNSVFSTLPITKVWEFFVTESVGHVPKLSTEALINKIYNQLLFMRTWQDVTSSRFNGATYTNDSQTDIFISIRAASASVVSRFLIVDGLTISATATTDSDTAMLQAVVPPGSTYQTQNVTSPSWFELRI